LQLLQDIFLKSGVFFSAAAELSMPVQQYLEGPVLDKAARNAAKGVAESAAKASLTADFHVYPDFHGNRAPLADPAMKGGLVGLTLGNDNVEDLALLYLAAVQAVAYGSRHIVDTMKQ